MPGLAGIDATLWCGQDRKRHHPRTTLRVASDCV
jgi:hypothetical protein